MQRTFPILILLALIQFTNVMDFMIMMPMGPDMLDIFNIHPFEFGYLVSSYTFAAGISGIAAAFYLDKFDRKKTLMITYAGFILGTMLCSFAHSYELLLFARIFTGLFGGIIGAQIFAIVADLIPFERRGAAMGVIMGAFSVASVLGVPFGLYLKDLYSWEAPFMMIGLAGVPIWFACFILLPPVNKHLQNPSGESSWDKIVSILNSKNARFALIMMVIMMLGHFMVVPNVATYMVGNVGVGNDELLYIYIVGGLTGLFSNPLAGKLADKFGKEIVFVYTILLTTIPVYIITHLGKTDLDLVLLLVAFFFAFSGARFSPAQALISETVTPAKRGAFMSFVSATQQIGAGIGSLIAGFMMTKNADESLEGFGNVGIASICISLCTLFFIYRIRPRNTAV